MKYMWVLLFMLSVSLGVGASRFERREAEYYLVAYANHYGVPVDFARAIVAQESGWQPCVVSSKGAVGLMQLMPETARGLGVKNRCDIRQNISGGIRYLAILMRQFHGDLRLVAAGYYAGSRVVRSRGLQYHNADVVSYVASVRRRVQQQRNANPNQEKKKQTQ